MFGYLKKKGVGLNILKTLIRWYRGGKMNLYLTKILPIYIVIILAFGNTIVGNHEFQDEIVEVNDLLKSYSMPISTRGGGPGNMNWTLISNFTMGIYTGIDVGYYSKPAFADLDNDLDYDLVVGLGSGTLDYFQNIGTVSTPSFAAPTKLNISGININVGSPASPSIHDLDGDGDYDLVVGEGFGKFYYYQNTGTILNPIWATGVTLKSGGIDIKKGGFSTPTFADMDNDNDLDLTFGDWLGGLYYYENIGTNTTAVWTENTTMYSSVSLNASSVYICPEIVDLDDDGDYDLSVGEDWGFLYYFENTGDAVSPNWTENKLMYDKVGVLEWAGPAFADLFNDGDLDLTIGDINGTLTLYENEMIFVKKIRASVSLLNGNGASGKTCFAKYKSYTFKVTARSSEGVNDIKFVNLSLDHLGQNLKFQWDNTSRLFQELNDPNDYVELISTPSDATNDTVKTWTFYFKLKFNWSYPDENFHAIQVYCKGYSILYSWWNLTSAYRVENDLTFTGNLQVNAKFQGTLTSGDWVRKGENLTWGGLRTVYEGSTKNYPPNSEFDVYIWDNDGDYWSDTSSSGRNISINTTADLSTDINDTHIINITGPPSYCVNTTIPFIIRVDADNVTFTTPSPLSTLWQTTLTPTCGITVTDLGGTMVDAGSIEYMTSTDNGSLWSGWVTAGETVDLMSIDCQVNPTFLEGVDNLIKWQALDTVGNGYNESDEYRVIIDVTNLVFENFQPDAAVIHNTTLVDVEITVRDDVSGVAATSIEYTISTDDKTSWSPWASAGKTVDDNTIVCQESIAFENGTDNYIKWQANDVAGTGLVESEEFQIVIDTRLANKKPEVTLISPGNQSVITTTTPTLTWSVQDIDSTTLDYFVYLHTELDKVYNLDPSAKIAYLQDLASYTFTTELEDGMTYYWTVIPHDGIYYGTCTSGVWNFEIDITLPTPNATLLSPADLSVINLTSIELTWDLEYSGLDIVKYNVYFDTTSTPTELVSENQTSTSYLAEDLDDQTKYYWTVIPIAGDVVGNCISGVWSFTVILDEIEHIPKVTLSTPLDSAILSTTAAVLTWELDYSGSEIITFDVYLDIAQPPTNKISPSQQETTYSAEDLVDGTIYYWKIGILVNGVGDLFESVTWSFEIDLEFVQLYEVDLILERSEVTIDQGDSVSLNATILNLGNGVDSFTLDVDAGGLYDNVELERSDKIIILDPDESTTLKLTINIDNDTVVKNYTIKISVESKGDITGDTSDEKTLKVIVKKTDDGQDPEIPDTPGTPETDGDDKESDANYLIWIIPVIIVLILILITYFVHFRKRKEEESAPKSDVEPTPPQPQPESQPQPQPQPQPQIQPQVIPSPQPVQPVPTDQQPDPIAPPEELPVQPQEPSIPQTQEMTQPSPTIQEPVVVQAPQPVEQVQVQPSQNELEVEDESN
jgi:hypothetical protein